MFINRYEIMKNSEEIRKCLNDDESILLYDSRIDYFFSRDFYDYTKKILDMDHIWEISQIEVIMKKSPGINRIIVWGCGCEGKYVRRLLHRSEYKDKRIEFCDNNSNLWGNSINLTIGKDNVITKVVSPQMIKSDDETIVVIASQNYCGSIFEQLLNTLFPIEYIVYPRGVYGHHLYGKTGNQYFDCFLPSEEEVFVDCGCLNGNTSKEFVDWCNGNYKGIVAFEPNAAMTETCRNTFSMPVFHDVSLITKGVWNEAGVLSFYVNTETFMGGSRIKESGNQKIEVDSIDNALEGKEATFIKMDVEGSEFMAIVGAEKTIKRYSPKLALSIYHKPEDILEIPYIVHKFNPDYRFAIRQYASNMHETILYAWVD